MQVIKTYSGKRGCMCGCRGKWNYTNYGAEKYAPGYEVDISERGAKIIANKVINDASGVTEYMGDGLFGKFVETADTMKAVFYVE